LLFPANKLCLAPARERRQNYVFADIGNRIVHRWGLCPNGGRLFAGVSILNFSNFAHGTIIMLGAYVGYFIISNLKLGFTFSLVGAIIGAAILCGFERQAGLYTA